MDIHEETYVHNIATYHLRKAFFQVSAYIKFKCEPQTNVPVVNQFNCISKQKESKVLKFIVSLMPRLRLASSSTSPVFIIVFLLLLFFIHDGKASFSDDSSLTMLHGGIWILMLWATLMQETRYWNGFQQVHYNWCNRPKSWYLIHWFHSIKFSVI